MRLSKKLITLALTATSLPVIADVDQWLYWSAADSNKYAIPLITGSASNALTTDSSGNVVAYVKTKGTPADTELYIQVSPWEAPSHFQTGPPVALPASSKYVEVTYKSDTDILWQAREGNATNPLDCMHSYKHPVTTLPASPDVFTTARVMWTDFVNPHVWADETQTELAKLDISNVCKFNFVMLSPPAGSELTISDLSIDQYKPEDRRCEALGNCKINIEVIRPNSTIYRPLNQGTEVLVRATSNESEELKSITVQLNNVNGSVAEGGSELISGIIDNNQYGGNISGSNVESIKYVSVKVIDSLDNEHTSLPTKLVTNDYQPSGVTAWLNWYLLNSPANSALTEDANGNAVVEIINAANGTELAQHINPYTIKDDAVMGAPIDLSAQDPQWIQLTYKADTAVEWIIYEGHQTDAEDCHHGFGHNQLILPASTEFKTMRHPLTDFKTNGDNPELPEGHLLNVANLCKVQFHLPDGGNFSLTDMTIDNYDPASNAPVVEEENTAPTITAATAQTIEFGANLTLDLTMFTTTDAQGDALTLTVADGDDYTVDGLEVTPVADFSGDLLVNVTVNDGELSSATYQLPVTVNAQVIVVTPEPTPAPTPTAEKKSSGGSSSWIILFLLPLLSMRRKVNAK